MPTISPPYLRHFKSRFRAWQLQFRTHISRLVFWHSWLKLACFLPRQVRPKLALVTPWPPAKTGVAVHAQGLADLLGRFSNLTVVSPQEDPNVKWVSPSQFLEIHAQYHFVIFQFGNSSHHEFMLNMASKVQGIWVFHEPKAPHLLIDHAKTEQGQQSLMSSVFNFEGLGVFRSVYGLGGGFHALLPSAAVGNLLHNGTRMLVHSTHAKQILQKNYSWLNSSGVDVIPLLIPQHSVFARRPGKPRPWQQQLVVCSFGFVGPSKASIEIVQALNQLAHERSLKIKLVFVGRVSDPEYAKVLTKILSETNELLEVEITGWVSEADYFIWHQRCHLAIQLRVNGLGETSATLLQVLSQAIPCVSNESGAISQLPPHTGYWFGGAVTPGSIKAQVQAFLENPEQAKKRGQAARRHVLKAHRPTLVKRSYRNSLIASKIYPEQISRKRKIYIDFSDPAQPGGEPVHAWGKWPGVFETMAQNHPSVCIYPVYWCAHSNQFQLIQGFLQQGGFYALNNSPCVEILNLAAGDMVLTPLGNAPFPEEEIQALGVTIQTIDFKNLSAVLALSLQSLNPG